MGGTTVNILYTTDNKFIPKVCASMCSVFENNPDAEYIHIYIFGLNITEENAQSLQAFAQTYGQKLTLIALNAIETYYDFSFSTNGWHPIVLARLLVSRLLPDSVKRIIYLDGDTIVRGSLKRMWETDMGGKPLGGCFEPTYDKKRRMALGMENLPYINAGVLLMDISAYRTQGTGETIIDFYRHHAGQLFANDQDAINGALRNQIFVLPLIYNYCNTYHFYPYRTLKKLSAPVEFINKETYQHQCANPVIIHYLGEQRPWRRGNGHEYQAEYEKFLALTPFSSDPQETGFEAYFVCFRLFHALLKPFPLLRYRIINAMIPAFIRFRKRLMK